MRQRSVRPLVPCFALLMAMSVWPSEARSERREMDVYLVAAERLYENLEYERALEQLDRARQHASTIDDDVAIGLYEGIILLELGRADDANGAFRAALLLRPDASLPITVAPKIREVFEEVRGAVQTELAPILARQEEERASAEAARRAEEESAAAEAARLAEEERAAEESRLRAEEERLAAERALRMEEAVARGERTRLAEEEQIAAERARRTEEERAAAERARPAADEQAAAEARRKEEEERAARLREGSRTGRGQPPWADPPAPEDPAPRPRQPVLAYVLAGVAASAAGGGAYFGFQSEESVRAAQDSIYQDDTVAHLSVAGDHALRANVLFVSAGACALSAVVAWIAGREPRPSTETTSR